jgi:hypothetical protein
MGWPRALLLGKNSILINGAFDQRHIRSTGHLIALFSTFDMIGAIFVSKEGLQNAKF